jgi:hypothetical protein
MSTFCKREKCLGQVRISRKENYWKILKYKFVKNCALKLCNLYCSYKLCKEELHTNFGSSWRRPGRWAPKNFCIFVISDLELVIIDTKKVKISPGPLVDFFLFFLTLKPSLKMMILENLWQLKWLRKLKNV